MLESTEGAPGTNAEPRSEGAVSRSGTFAEAAIPALAMTHRDAASPEARRGIAKVALRDPQKAGASGLGTRGRNTTRRGGSDRALLFD
jgi:hypothetical protein